INFMISRIRNLATILFSVDTPALSAQERRRSTAGALLGIGFCGLILYYIPISSHWLIAPIGASAVVLFTLPHSPLAQPWSIMGSYLFAASAALLSVALIPQSQLAAAVAVAATIWLMARFNCIHPSGGAIALFVVLEGPYSQDKIGPMLGLVALNGVLILLASILVNNLVLGRRYPYRPKVEDKNIHQTDDTNPLERNGITHPDLQSAMKKLDTFVDVQENELIQIYRLAVDHAFERNVGLTCGDIMSRDLITVNFGTSLEEAWSQLRKHKVKALPVVDNFNTLIGILTVADFLRQMDDTTSAGVAIRLQGLLKRTSGPTSEKAEVVGQIMSSKVYTAQTDTPISEILRHMTDHSIRHVPIIDDRKKIIGIVTQSDLLGALYRRLALSAA
ncbi:MAG TPA: hypothetical protein DDY24_02765, partial [Alcaligenaceae bacterium]|nr:hypothetical protein [Alcaligenaceae bacterium]